MNVKVAEWELSAEIVFRSVSRYGEFICPVEGCGQRLTAGKVAVVIYRQETNETKIACARHDWMEE